MAVLASDGFTHDDGSQLDGTDTDSAYGGSTYTWDQLGGYHGFVAMFEIIHYEATPRVGLAGNPTSGRDMDYVGPLGTDDMAVTATMLVLPWEEAEENLIGITARSNGLTWYEFVVNGPGDWQVNSANALGSTGTLMSGAGVTAGQTITLATFGSTITALIDGVVADSTTDTTVAAGQYAGITGLGGNPGVTPRVGDFIVEDTEPDIGPPEDTTYAGPLIQATIDLTLGVTFIGEPRLAPVALTIDLDLTVTRTTNRKDWWAQLMHYQSDGAVVPVARLVKAELGEIVETLNDMATTSFTIGFGDNPVAVTAICEAADKTSDYYPLPSLELQVWRGEELWLFGPLTDRTWEDGKVQASVADAFWHVTRRHPGRMGYTTGGEDRGVDSEGDPIEVDDQIINPFFDDGLAGWGQFRTIDLNDVPGFDVVDPTVITVQPASALPAAPTPGRRVIKGTTPATNRHDAYQLWQDITVIAGLVTPIRFRATLQIWIPSTVDFGAATSLPGLQISWYDDEFDKPAAYYLPIAMVEARIPSTVARDTWVLLETEELEIPPLVGEQRIHIGYTFPAGCTTYITASDGPLYDSEGWGWFQADAAQVSNFIVAKVMGQDHGKTGGRVGYDFEPTGEVITSAVSLAEHPNAADMIHQLSRDGRFDWWMRYTPISRTFVAQRRRGAYQPNCRINRKSAAHVKHSDNWASGATAVEVQTQGSMHHAAGAHIEGALVIEDVAIAGRDLQPKDLPGYAIEHLASVSEPQVMEVTTTPGSPLVSKMKIGDWTDALIDDQGLHVEGTWRLVRRTTSPATDTAVCELNRFTP